MTLQLVAMATSLKPSEKRVKSVIYDQIPIAYHGENVEKTVQKNIEKFVTNF